MQNLPLSEMMHTFPLRGFEISGDFNKDIANYVEFKKMPLSHQSLDNELYTFPLFRLSFGKTITVHTLTDGVVEKVKHTKMENMPNEIPNLMKHSFLIEARREKPLFNDVYSIGGFVLNDEICLVMKTISENEPGLFCQHEKTSFDGRKIEDLNLIYDRKIGNIDPSYIQARTRKDTFAFAIIFSLMLEAERTPLLIETKNDKTGKKNSNAKRPNNETGWITKRVYIDKTLKYKKNPNDQIAFDKTDKQLKNVIVNGYLRKQHYGPESYLEKWIYIESFPSTRWTNDKDKRIIVDIHEKSKNSKTQ
jgi:hypothetical protein